MKKIILFYALIQHASFSSDDRHQISDDFKRFAEQFVVVPSSTDDIVNGKLELHQIKNSTETDSLMHVLSRAITTVPWLSELTLCGFNLTSLPYSNMFANLKSKNYTLKN